METTARWLRPAISKAGPFTVFNPTGTDIEILKLRENYEPSDTDMGKIDLEMMQARATKNELERKELIAANSNMQGSLSRLGSQRDILARQLAELTGKPFKVVLEELESDYKTTEAIKRFKEQQDRKH